jgi:hypothetical protein
MTVILPTLAALTTVSVATAEQVTGPSSSQTPYIVPVAQEVDTVSLITVGDSVNLKPHGKTPYRYVGIPDGMGAYDNGDGTFTVLSNHELGAGVGITRAHGGLS